MRRRVLAAVLFVLALVVLAVGFLRDTGGPKTEAAKGKQWIDSSGVTRSVASIVARQRFVERHPEPQPHPALLLPAEGDSGEGAPQIAGATRVGGRKVEEKPEPGEESLPPKVAGPAPPLPRTGRSAIGPKSNLSSGTSFLGADFGDSGFVPPDSMGAVGPTQVLVDVNGWLRVFDKSGNQNPGELDIADSTFWDSELPPGVEPTDPSVEYDRLSGRWIISAISVQTTNNRVMLAVSDSSTITDETGFTFYSFPESGPIGGSPRFADYPQLGVDANAIYIGANEFANSSGSFTGTDLYVIQKSSAIGGGPLTVNGFRTVNNPVSAGPDSPQPATTSDPTVNAGYVIGPDNLILNQMDVVRVNNPGTATPTLTTGLSVALPSTAQPLAVPAQGAAGGIDALDDRFFEAMIGRGPDGSDTLWTAHNIRVNSSGVGTASGDRDGSRWYQVGNLDTTPSLIQSGTMFDTAGSNPRFFWMPSIAMNGQGHASLNMSTAGAGRFAEIASTGRLATDPLNTTEPFDLTQSSSSSYNLGQQSPRRWGDYSQTVVDPTDDQTFWTFQEYANANNSWGVRVIQLKAPPPAVPESASPSTVLADANPHVVQVTGTSANGSGFFDTVDPGTPYPAYDHVSASVSNGVVVNSVTVTDPTHVTLDLDTSAATNGFASITITNPDGQSSTCSNALIIGADSTAPSTPFPQGTSPSSPGNNNTPKVFGSNADCGADVSLYTDSACTSPAVATQPASQFASPGIPVSVPDNSTTTFFAQSTSVNNLDSPCSSSGFTYVEDSIPPQVSVTSGPTGTITDKTPTFTFEATDAVGPITFRCSIDAGAPSFGACSGPGTSDTPSSSLGDGSYTFRVQATDAAGNAAVATRAFVVQTPSSPPPTAPDTSIKKGPTKTRKRKPKIKFTSSQVGSTFQCKLDRGAFTPCTSPFVPPVKLLPGKHVFKVQAIGPTGVADPQPAVRKFKVLG